MLEMLINKGKNLSTASIGAFTDDFFATSRPQGAAWDIGIYENGVITDIAPPSTPQNVKVSSLSTATVQLIWP